MLKQAEDFADELGDKLGLAEAVRGPGQGVPGAARVHEGARVHASARWSSSARPRARCSSGVALRSLGEVTAAASAGGAGLRDAAEHLKRSIAIFEEVGNEVELARSCRAYAELLRQTPDTRTIRDRGARRARSSKRAEDIFAKMRASAGGHGGEAVPR